MYRLYKPHLLIALVIIMTFACSSLSTSDSPPSPPPNAIVVEVVANTGITTWLETAIERFNASKTSLPSDNDPIYVTLNPMEAGQAVTTMATGEISPDLWIPDDLVWIDVMSNNNQNSFQLDCSSIAQSPLVIAMWKPVAEALGWPSRQLGWLDIGSLAADPSAWIYYSGGKFGDTLRLGHTHPGLSGTGSATLLAIVQAAQSKNDAVTVADIEKPIVQASVGAFEGAVSWFSSDTDTLGRIMRERGLGFLGAAVMYENTVIEYGAGDPEIVPIYPFEGTFMATHPACINGSNNISQQEAARIFRDYLVSEDMQQFALENGLRPVITDILSDETRGIDIKQPQTIFESPTLDTIYAIQEIWQSARKPVNLVMLLDTSGSMQGTKIDNLKTAAVQFVEQMGDDDFLTLIRFDSSPVILIERVQIGTSRTQLIQIIERLDANGNTTLYDAIGDGAQVIAQTTSPQTTNALVILTDGKDTASERYRLNTSLIDAAAANDTTVFTIAYGKDAEEKILSDLANRANGNFYLGDEASITAIYQEMSAAFGGSVGIGR